MSGVPSQPGLYRMDIAGHTYYGETTDLFRRRATHWRELLSKKHHNILLRRLVCEYGIASVSFTVIAAGPQWSDAALRKAEEARLMTSDPNSLNSNGLLGVYATQLRLPDKVKYRLRTLHVEFSRGVAWVREERGGRLVGIERARGKIKSGYYASDDRSFINAAPNIRRNGGQQVGAGGVHAVGAGPGPAVRLAIPGGQGGQECLYDKEKGEVVHRVPRGPRPGVGAAGAGGAAPAVGRGKAGAGRRPAAGDAVPLRDELRPRR